MIDDGFRVFALLVSALVVLIPAATGLTMIIRGLRHWNRARRLTDTGEQATATVVDNQLESHSHGSVAFRPIVTFTTRTGREVRTVLADQVSHRSHLPGSQQTVAFDPEQPDRAVSADGQTAGAARALIIGSIFLLFAGVALVLVTMTFLSPGSPLSPDSGFPDLLNDTP